ncbi:hypothetical protein NMG60_11008833 [Bertholletia excelsa]
MKLPRPWQWPICKEPKTLSFRGPDHMFKTVSSVADLVQTPESSNCSNTCSSTSACSSTHYDESEDSAGDGLESLEMIIRAAQSERLFFEPDDARSLFPFPFKESVAMAMESEDPLKDFRWSMKEMVESHGLKDWDSLEELLGWYLRVNVRINHGFIIGAFIDLLVGMLASASDDSTTSFSSAVSSFSSPSSPLSPLGQKEIEDAEEDDLAIC